VTTAAPNLLTVPEVMGRLKVSRSKVYDLIRSNRLASMKIDGCRRISDEVVSDFIRRGMGGTA